jgi:hypothetical protein
MSTQTAVPQAPEGVQSSQQFGPSTQIHTEGRSRASSLSVDSFIYLNLSERTPQEADKAARSITAISQLAAPDNTPWKGSIDSRSMRRFLDAVGRKVQASGLTAHAAFHYLLNKCLGPSLAEEVLDNCPGAALGDYVAACGEASRFLMKTFELTNRPSRFTEKAESLDWARGASTIDEYRYNFNRLTKEAELLGVSLTEDNMTRLYKKGLPARLREICDERYDDDMPLHTLMNKVELVCSRQGNFFDAASRKAARVAAVHEGEERPVVGKQAGDERQSNMQCYGCKEFGHIKRFCKNRGKLRAAPITEQRQDSTDGNTGGAVDSEIPWIGSIRLCRATAGKARDDPLVEVRIDSVSGNETVTKRALLDTGAQLSLCTRGFADELYRLKLVKSSDIVMKAGPTIILADGKATLKDLGTVKVAIEGQKIDLRVIDGTLCAPLIIGYDQIRENASLMEKLTRKLTRGLESPKEKIFTAAMSLESDGGIDFAPYGNIDTEMHAGGNLEQDTAEEPADEAKVSQHCDWPPIELTWKAGAVAGLKPNLRQAVGEARQLEARMAKRNPAMLSAYAEILATWEQAGWIEQIQRDQVRFCLRHFGVTKDPAGKTAMSRCRVVVDGSGLTPLLDVPPCFHTDIVKNVLLLMNAVVFTVVDLSQAYMRVQLSEKDSFYLCIHFGGKWFRFRSLPMGISPSAEALQRVIDGFVQEYLGLQKPSLDGVDIDVAPYMDDLIQLGWIRPGSVCSKEAVEMRMQDELVAFMTKKRMSVSRDKILTSASPAGTVLGVKISLGDRIGVACKFAKLGRGEIKDLVQRGLTRRRALGILSSFFDPLGLCIELQMAARLQASALGGLAWDSQVSPKEASDVGKWLEMCKEAVNMTTPRELDVRRVFIFPDASHVGYSAIAVARDNCGVWRRLVGRAWTYKGYQRKWTSVSSKIETLALQAGVELAHYLKKVYERVPEYVRPCEFIFGVDNETVLNRFQAREFASIQDRWERKVSTVVINSLANLQAKIFHIRGESNCADAASRGIWRDVDHDVSVKAFVACRAVTPVPFSERIFTEDEVPEVVVAAMDDSGEVSGTAESAVGMSLWERFDAEAPTRSRADWLRDYQEADAKMPKLVLRKQIEVRNGVWVSKFRQNLTGEWKWPVYIPVELVPNALMTIHDRAGHYGVFKSQVKARNEYYWPGMSAQVKKHVVGCSVCQQIKGSREWATEPQPVSTVGKAWSVVGIDTVGGFGDSHKVLTVSCLFTRYVYTFLLSSETSKLVCKALRGVFAVEGPPLIVCSDNAEVFTCRETQMLLRSWGVDHRLIPRYAPWYGGFYEVVHKTLAKTIAAVMLETAVSDWRRTLQVATFLYNSRPYKCDSGLCPHEVFRGRRSIAVWTDDGLDVEDALRLTDDIEGTTQIALDERKRLLEWHEEVWIEMRAASAREIQRRMKGTDRVRVGAEVYVYVPRIRRNKTEPAWVGPYKVEEKLSSVTWVVNGKVEHSFNLKVAAGRDQEYVTPAAEVARKRGRDEEEADVPRGSGTRGSKLTRLACLLAYQPRGDLLWI